MICWCENGIYRHKGHRWVRVPSGDGFVVKCLECGKKWNSNRQYVKRLPIHKERTRTGMNDQDILDLLNSGMITVDIDNAVVFSFAKSRKRKLSIEFRTRPGRDESDTYRFVTICAQGKKKKISLHRIVWMAKHRELIPDGYDVDHVHGKNVDNADAIWNLRLLASSVNRSNADVPF